MKKILAIILALTLVLSFGACATKDNAQDPTGASSATEAADSDLAYMQSNGKMVIGYTLYEPMNYTDENGELTGFDTEFAKAVCAKLGLEPEFVVIDWDNKFLELESKGIDCVWNGMTISDEVLQNSDVTDPYAKNAQVVVMKKENIDKYQTIESLSELTFAAEAGSTGAAAIKDNVPSASVVEVNAQTDALLEVMSGAVDACAIDITMANSMLKEGSDYASLTYKLELSSEQYGIAFRKGSDLTAKVNEIIDELIDDGTLDALAEKYEITLVK